ncbi:Thylakoid lumenal 15.0 kDa protein 2, chloroplastic [Zostera marina]|uniref:Thylakoid lumenal 15.0 kDa protein 2, chloroplastic n=1 Tax=Zostera marina TaxID=29655 RepID=A0A0K9PF31_ZOSMR|nr:Thylakoid lumenal 15.0 kDa protein 2, chloroplastic [Zostera marina]
MSSSTLLLQFLPPVCYRSRAKTLKASSIHPPPSLWQARSDRIGFRKWIGESVSKSAKLAFSSAFALSLLMSGIDYADAKDGVNKPDWLPKEFTTVIDVAGFLSSGQENRLIQEIASLEKDTGYKLRILAQNFPETPGLAIKDFWKVDDKTIVFVADPTFGNIIHFNVGQSVDLEVPRNFWSRVEGKYGNMFYWRDNGEDASVDGAVMAITKCLRNPEDPNSCSEVF